jgi:hypothetical protein
VDELPQMDRGAKVILVKEGGAEMAQVPWNSPGEQGIEEEVQASLEADLSASLRFRGRARGDDASAFRAYFEVPGRRRFELERIFGARFAGAAVESERFSDLRDRSRPVEFEVAVKAPGFVARAPEGEVIQVLDDFFETARKYAAAGSLEERRHDLLLGPPWQSKLRVVYLLPPGFRVRSVPQDREVSGRFGSLAVRYRRSEEGGRQAVTLERTFETTANRVLKADYAEFRELSTALARLKDERIVMERVP